MRLLLPACLLAAVAPLSANPLDARRIDPERVSVSAALERVERGAVIDDAMRRSLGGHPLLPWLEYAELRQQLGRRTPDEVAALLARHPELPFAGPLRRAWLRELAKRRDWAGFVALYREADDAGEADLRCHALSARLATGALDDALAAAIADAWRHGDSRPDACDAPFAALQRAGRLDDALRWERIVLAAEAGNAGLVRFLARALPPTDKLQAERYASFLDAPDRSAATWPRDERSRRVATRGLERLARSDPAAAERLMVELAALGLDAAQQSRVRYQAALWSAAAYLPNAAQRLAAVPADAYDARLHEWRVREALARSDWTAALQAILAMPAELRTEPRWRYLEARMRDFGGEAAAATAAWRELAREPNYHGFLAADRLALPYALCPLPSPDDAAQAAMAADPQLVRAVWLHAMGRRSWAEQEWRGLAARLDADARRAAVAVAVGARWHDRAVFGLQAPEDLTYYALRFPLAQRATLRREARRHGLDDAWVAALIRAESAWQPEARSSADARGLMQLLPGTGAATARRLGLPWNGNRTLHEPRANIALGTAHLATELARHGGQPYLATAAYNAGPAPVGRWLAQRAAHDVDLWVETIPYRETREYVGRIMAFAVIYDWRLHGAALPVSERMRGRHDAARRPFACPAAPPSTSP